MKRIRKTTSLLMLIIIILSLGGCNRKDSESSNMLKAANTYIQNNSKNVDPKFRHTYHLMPTYGWSNDPNGLVFYKGEYHLFYQHYPYESLPGDLGTFWGHAKSKDLVRWENLPIAIAPDKDYDKNGCWSGGAIEKDGNLYLMYTGNSVKDGIATQTQNIAISYDGINFVKYEGNPVISDVNMPDEASRRDFRDPFVWEKDGNYYALIGSKYKMYSQMLLYKSVDLLDWTYIGVALKGNFGRMAECPNFVSMPNCDLILFSPQEKVAEGYSYWNTSSTAYLTGKLNYETGEFVTDGIMREIDFGMDFYATQCLQNTEYGTVMNAWMNMWGRNFISAEAGHNWQGSYVLPRILEVKDGNLLQKPIDSIKNYFEDEISVSEEISGEVEFDGISGRCLALNIRADLSNAEELTIRLFADVDTYTDLVISKGGIIKIDRTKSNYLPGGLSFEKSKDGIRYAQYPQNTNIFEFDIYLDNISIEAFFGDGSLVMTSLSYNELNCDKIIFISEGIVKLDLKKNTIKVK